MGNNKHTKSSKTDRNKRNQEPQTLGFHNAPVEDTVGTPQVNSDQGKEDLKSEPQENITVEKSSASKEEGVVLSAFQRLLVKIGGIKIPDISSSNKKNEELESQLSRVNTEKEGLSKQIDKLSSELSNYRTIFRNSVQVLDPEVIADNISSQAARNIIIAKIRDIVNKNSALSTEVEEYKHRLETLKRESSVTPPPIYQESKKDDDNKKFEEFRAKELQEKHALREGKKNLEGLISDLKQKLNLKESAIASLNKSLDEIKVKLGEGEENLRVKETEIQDLASQIQDNKTIIGKLNNDINLLSKEKEEIKNERNSAIEKCKALEATEVGTLTAKLTEAESKIEELNTSMTDLNNRISAKENEINSLNSELKLKGEQIETLEADKNKISQTLKEIEDSLSNSKKEIEEKKGEISNLNRSIDLYRKDIEAKSSELQQKETNIQQLENDMAEKKEELKLANEEIQSHLSTIQSKDAEISSLSSNLEKEKEELKATKDNLSQSEEQTRQCIIDFHSLIKDETNKVKSVLENGKYEHGEGDMMEAALDDEDTNMRAFSKLASKIEQIAPESFKSVKEIKEKCLEILAEEINKEAAGVITPLARLCAYSRMPFMRDYQGDEYMILDRSRLVELETHLSALLALVGIELIIPTPYCDNISEGEFEERQGDISNLDYICPNARQHLDKVDRTNQKDIITDIICVGYRIPGQPVQKAKVIL